ncbi:MAG TPA: TetR/AcrR family transcriptional regulator [Burkholderiales bacterium]|nr:TetR/AcrR family transcriptional regulator [Burkholderiales bacterium]
MSISAQTAKKAALALAKERPEMGKVRAARELRGRGIQLSASAVHAIWKQHGLASSYERLRMRASRNAGALSDSQRARLRRATISRRVTARAGANGSSEAHPRREELIAAAARIFGARGYEGASLRDICAAAGILAGSMYHHFRSKEDLFVSVNAEGFRRLNRVVDWALKGKPDPWQRIEAAIAAHLAELVENADVVAVTAASLFHMERTRLQRRLNREREAYENRFRRLILALPLPSDVDRSLLRLTLLGAINWTRVWYRPGKRTPAQIAHHLVHKVLRKALG